VDAFSPTLGFAARVISVCVLLFIGLVAFIFWLGNLSQKKEAATEETVPAPQTGLQSEPVAAD
jgi:hypothetical protein